MERIAHYHILDRIGAGGLGEVYRARDTRLGRTVAVKVLPDSVSRDPERRARFLADARASAALSHPNLCALFDVGEEGDRVYLVFEHLAGDTLRRAIAGRALNLRAALETSIQLADALAEAHAAGIVHRDIRPENIMLTARGHPKIVDFGLASFTASGVAREAAAAELSTSDSVALTSVAYMSPEQVLGVGFDHRTDIFSLGIVIYEMLTGSSPFKAPTGSAMAIQIVQSTPQPPSVINPKVPKELDGILLRALAKDPNQRYQSAAALAAELRSVAAILDVREVAELEEVAATGRPSWTRTAAIVAIVAAVAAAVGFVRVPAKALWASWSRSVPPPILVAVPFDLVGSDRSAFYVADGLTDDIVVRLGMIPGMQVLGRSATRQYRGRDPREVARELNASVALSGAVDNDRDRLRVRVSAVDSETGVSIWSARYEKPWSEVFAVQTQIAEDVARRLRLHVAPSAWSERSRSRRVDRGAYDLYLRARDAAARREFETAVELYRQSIAVDAAVAEAHAGLAEAIHLLDVVDRRLTPALADQMRRAALASADVDPDLPEAQLALGISESSRAEALKRFRRAIELDSSYSAAYRQLADELMVPDPDRAIAFYRRAVALDPRAATASAGLAAAYVNANRLGEAEQALRSAPQEVSIGVRSVLALARKRPDETVALLQGPGRADALVKSVRSASPLLLHLSALQQAGEMDRARTLAERLAERFTGDCAAQALAAAFRYRVRDDSGAHALVDRYLIAAAEEHATPLEMRCAPLAAAAVADAGRAAEFLTRISANEEYLRDWTRDIIGTSANTWVRHGWFPFELIAENPEVVKAQAAITRTLSAHRQTAAGLIGDLLTSPPGSLRAQ